MPCSILRTGTFREAQKEDYVIKQTGTSYDPAAVCPRWEKFLSRVLSDNAELISFVQRAVGYSLTANTVEQVLFFLYASATAFRYAANLGPAGFYERNG
jgi:putative DNA primase/helicase